MATRSAIGKTLNNTDGDVLIVDGSYVHDDGYPTVRGPILMELIHRDGVDTVLATLAENTWSHLDPKMTAGDSSDTRMTKIPGYGLAHGNDLIGDTFPGTQLDVEWYYGISDTEITVVRVPYGDDSQAKVVGTIALDDPNPDWERMECGANYETCNHYASYHFPNVPADCRNIGTRTWLGYDPLTPGDAIAVKIGRRKFTAPGSMSLLPLPPFMPGTGTDAEVAKRAAKGENLFTDRRYRLNDRARNYWVWLGAKATDGTRVDIPVSRTAHGPAIDGVTYIYPKLPVRQEVA